MELDILGQQPSLRIYTQLSFCYPMGILEDRDIVVGKLLKGLEILSSSFPWIAGQIVNIGASETSSGIYKIQNLEETPRLVVKDLQNDPSAPTWEMLVQMEFPMRLLDEDMIAPGRTIPGGPGWSSSDPERVFLVQANFICGGLILTFNGQHAAMDMIGQAEMIRLFNKACKGEAFTEQEIANGNTSRTETIPKYDENFIPGKEIESFLLPTDREHAPFNDVAKSSWVYFSFGAVAQAALKEKASNDMTSGFVSSDDCISAFIWQSASRARAARLESFTETRLCRCIDMRRYMDAPSAYPGMLLTMTTSNSSIGELISQPLGVTASELRSRLDGPLLAYQTRSLATYISRTADKSGVSLSATLTPIDFQLSSWGKVDCYGFDFGIGLGLPVSVRRPRFTPVESLMYLMPKRPDGEASAAVCLREDDLELLKKDPEFAQYAKYVG